MHTNTLSTRFRYINTLIVILTTAIFIGFIIREYRDLERYMSYVAENGKSALSHAEYINQNMAFQLSRAFSAAPHRQTSKGFSGTTFAHILNR